VRDLRPTEAVERAHSFVREYDLRFADCFALDGVLETPFAPPGFPHKTVGREAIRDLLRPNYEAAKKAGRRIIEYRDLRIHETTDPELMVAEFELIGADSDEEPYSVRFIQVVRVRAGEIVEMRDYFDSWRMANRLEGGAGQRSA
jgi:ketosteroid isomerase-like protein